MGGRFGKWNKKTGVFEWNDAMMPVGPRRARAAGLPMNLRLYTVRETAVVLRHSIYWVRAQIRADRIRAIKLGNGYFITVLELARVMGGVTGFEKCGTGSANSGKTRHRPVTNTSGNGTSPGASTAGSAGSGRATFTSGRPRSPVIPRPLITSPGK